MIVTRSIAWTHRREDYSDGLAQANLLRIVLEAALWCHSRARPEDARACLRAEALRPYQFNDSRYDSVHDVAAARHRELCELGAIPRLHGRAEDRIPIAEAGLTEAIEIARGGRLLVWVRDDTIDDGAGEAITSGYLDVSDMPPWDTWIAYYGGSLISWVPRPFVPSLDEAIVANAYGALFWLRRGSGAVSRVLDDADLLVD